MRGEYGIMVDADAATDIEDLDRLLIRMRDVETMKDLLAPAEEGGVGSGKKKHGMVVGSRAHMEGEAVAKVRVSRAGSTVPSNRGRFVSVFVLFFAIFVFIVFSNVEVAAVAVAVAVAVAKTLVLSVLTLAWHAH